MSALLLGSSLVALAIAPWLSGVAERAARLMALLDGFVFVAIGGLVVAHVLPEAVEAAGWSALLVALLGLAGPLVIERWLHGAARQVHTAALFLAIVGIVGTPSSNANGLICRTMSPPSP